jgi:hypothetical protein
MAQHIKKAFYQKYRTELVCNLYQSEEYERSDFIDHIKYVCY